MSFYFATVKFESVILVSLVSGILDPFWALPFVAIAITYFNAWICIYWVFYNKIRDLLIDVCMYLCMYMYACIFVCTCMHVSVYVHVCMYLCMYIYACICVCTCRPMYVSVYVHVYVNLCFLTFSALHMQVREIK